jgi:hypothetical protein
MAIAWRRDGVSPRENRVAPRAPEGGPAAAFSKIIAVLQARALAGPNGEMKNHL